MGAAVLTLIISRDFSVMNKTVVLAKANNVLVGAHPSLPDLQGFGRREMAVEPVRRPAVLWSTELISRFRMNSRLASSTKSALWTAS